MDELTHDEKVEECRKKNSNSSVTESTSQQEVLAEKLLEDSKLKSLDDEEEFEEMSGIGG
ncbi:14956_t:CDS:2 [Acaulospora colombiana]|uniref:14956_t:CDS:1 n=1 Tax=Acaulospora colombiana TaxID=27376 RepID=A0ACA9N6A3_9GLOM|nr:14956_t:CDS:2 [Acaulospora colombiana]